MRQLRGPREIADFVGWKDEMDGKVLYRRCDNSGVPAKSQISWGWQDEMDGKVLYRR